MHKDGVLLKFVGEPSCFYVLQSATNLASPVRWQAILTNAADTNGVSRCTDSNLNSTVKFYRVAGPL